MAVSKTFPNRAVLVGARALRDLLAQGEDIRSTDEKGRTALFRTCRVGHTEKVMMLLEAGADPNAVDHQDEAPLQVAVRYGHIECVRLLLAAGAALDHCPSATLTEYSETALCSAVRHAAAEVAFLLLEKGADPNLASEAGRYPLMFACEVGNPELVRRLLLHKASIHVTNKAKETPLHAAIRAGNTQSVELLLKLGADLERKDRWNNTPLFKALQTESDDTLPILKLLLDAGPDLSKTGSWQNELPLDVAVSSGNMQAVDLLKAAGAPGRFRELGEDEDDEEEIESESFHPTISKADEDLAWKAKAIVSPVVRSLGWQASPRHWRILEAAQDAQPFLSVRRLAYIARGCFNLPPGMKVTEVDPLLGESYQAAVNRFVDAGYLERAGIVYEVERSFTAEELKQLAKCNRLKTSGIKKELVGRLIDRLPPETFQRRLQEIGGYYRMTVSGHTALTAGRVQLTRVIAGLRRDLLEKLRCDQLDSGVELAWALHSILDDGNFPTDVPQAKEIAAARFLLHATIPPALELPFALKRDCQFIMAAQALVQDQRAIWQTWDNQMPAVKTPGGLDVPLEELSLFLLTKGQSSRCSGWAEEIKTKEQLTGEMLHRQWPEEQKSLRERLGEEVVIVEFERLQFREDQKGVIDVLGSEEMYYAVGPDFTIRLAADEGEWVHKAAEGVDINLCFSTSPLQRRSILEAQRLQSELGEARLMDKGQDTDYHVEIVHMLLLTGKDPLASKDKAGGTNE